MKALPINEIINDDCMKAMAKFQDESVKVVITSPPYNLAGLQGYIKKPSKKNDRWMGRTIEYDGQPFGDFMEESEYQQSQVDFLNEVHRILTPDGSIFYNHQIRFHNHKAIHPLEWVLKTKLNFRQQIIWDRISGPNLSPKRYIPSTQLILWCTKTQAQPLFERQEFIQFKGEVWTIPPRPNELHPAPFPEEIPENILRCIPNPKKDVIVLDPYNGIGNTTVVAKRLGFKFIGIDKSATYCKIAIERTLNATPQQLLSYMDGNIQ